MSNCSPESCNYNDSVIAINSCLCNDRLQQCVVTDILVSADMQEDMVSHILIGYEVILNLQTVGVESLDNGEK